MPDGFELYVYTAADKRNYIACEKTEKCANNASYVCVSCKDKDEVVNLK